jgi:hypothetical protein
MTPEAKCGELYISAILSLQTPDPSKLRLNQDRWMIYMDSKFGQQTDKKFGRRKKKSL